MTDLHELFQAAASGAAPPSRLTAEALFTAGRRRHRFRTAATASALMAALVGGVTGAVAMAGAGGTGGDTPTPPSGTVSVPGPNAADMWAGGYDSQHLYLLRQACPVSPTIVSATPTCLPELLASTDGGVSWQVRNRSVDAVSLQILGPDTLLSGSPFSVSPGVDGTPPPQVWEKITFDGGRTWTATMEGAPIDFIPPGARLVPWRQFGAIYTPLYVADPETRTMRRLSTVPHLLAPRANQSVPTGAGYWVSGLDPDSHKPAIAVSHDSGRSWSTFVFADLESYNEQEMQSFHVNQMVVASRDGQLAYALQNVDGTARVFRTTDGGTTWTRVDLGGTVATSYEPPLVLPDGSHVVLSFLYGGTVGEAMRALTSADGTEYHEMTFTGLPTEAIPHMMDGGGYLAHSWNGVYLSSDGRAWHTIWGN